MNNSLAWIVGGALAIGAFFLIAKRKANASTITSNDVITQGRSLAPIPGQNAPSLSLCQTAVTIGGAAVGQYYGAPPQVTLPAGAVLSGPICSMGAKIGGKAYSAVNTAGQVVSKSSLIVATGNLDIAKDTLRLAGKVTDPVQFAKSAAILSTKPVTVPIKTTIAVGSVVAGGLKKADPRKWF